MQKHYVVVLLQRYIFTVGRIESLTNLTVYCCNQTTTIKYISHLLYFLHLTPAPWAKGLRSYYNFRLAHIFIQIHI